MERFAIKINANVRSNLYNICRLCGMDYPDKVNIIQQDTLKNVKLDENDEPTLCNKIFQCVGIQISKHDKMPQSACVLCHDKINDFFEFREMCWSADLQIRKLLGFTEEADQILPVEESILNTSSSTNAARKSTNKKTDSTPEERNDSKLNESSERQAINKRKNVPSKWDEPPSRKRRCVASKVLMKKKLKKLPPRGAVKNSKTLGINGKCLKTKPVPPSGVTTRRTFLEKSVREKGKQVPKTENSIKLSPRKLRTRDSRPSYCSRTRNENAITTYVLRGKVSRESLNTPIKNRNETTCPTCGKYFVIKKRLKKHIPLCSSKSRITASDESSKLSDNKLEKIEMLREEKDKDFIAPASFVVIPNSSSTNYKENIPAMENLYKTSVEVKKEPVHDCDIIRQSDENISRVKEEVIESPPCATKNSVLNVHDETKSCNLKPALKLRIKKEHGTLNSCLIEQTDGGSYLYSPSKKKKHKTIKPLRFETFKQEEDDSDVNINFACNIRTVPFLQQNCFTTTHAYEDYVELGREPNLNQDVKIPVISTVISADGTTLSINTESGVGKNISDVKIKSEFNINLSVAEQDKINCNFNEALIPKSETPEIGNESIK